MVAWHCEPDWRPSLWVKSEVGASSFEWHVRAQFTRTYVAQRNLVPQLGLIGRDRWVVEKKQRCYSEHGDEAVEYRLP